MNLVKRSVLALESIAKSLGSLSEELKANKQLKIELLGNVTELERKLNELIDDPFSFITKEKE